MRVCVLHRFPLKRGASYIRFYFTRYFFLLMASLKSISSSFYSSVALDDPLLIAAYSHQFFHAYAPPHTTRDGMELFGQVLRQCVGLNSGDSKRYVAGFELAWRPPIDEWAQAKGKYRAAASAAASSSSTELTLNGPSDISLPPFAVPPLPVPLPSSPPAPLPSSSSSSPLPPPLTRPRLCFVSSFLYGGHQLVRIFDEVARRLPSKG